MGSAAVRGAKPAGTYPKSTASESLSDTAEKLASERSSAVAV